MPEYVHMRLFAALVPPQGVLDDLTAVVRSVRGAPDELQQLPADLLHVPLANFGNVGLGDALDLREAMLQEMAYWSPLELRFRGGGALEDDGDDSVWARLDGDVEHLSAIGAVVPRVVQRLGFLVDRRFFRPRVRVGRITASTTAKYLERLVERLEGYAGPAWTAYDVALLRARESGPQQTDTAFEVMHLLPLAGEDTSGDASGGRHRSDALHPPGAGAPLDYDDEAETA